MHAVWSEIGRLDHHERLRAAERWRQAQMARQPRRPARPGQRTRLALGRSRWPRFVGT